MSLRKSTHDKDTQWRIQDFLDGNIMNRTGLPRHRENREFGSSFFQTGKTQGICKKLSKMHFYTGNLTQTQGKFGGEKVNNEFVIQVD